jgi:hypothetical protein
VDDFKDEVPSEWREHGGAMLPIFQSEALWLNFRSENVPTQGTYPFAVKVAAGKMSAVTGRLWQSGLHEKDYLIIPKQPWLDGYVVEKGIIRQFVAAPLGAGVTVEEQLTGKAEFGGIQIEVFPMKREAFERHFPVQDRTNISNRRGLLKSCAVRSRSTYDMGLAAGGRMKQQIFEDPYELEDWDVSHKAQSNRCFVHLANSLVWKAITKQDPPTTPCTSKAYSQAGYPWFDYYVEGAHAVSATSALEGIKSIGEIAPFLLPENESAVPKVVKNLSPGSPIRDGKWA